MYTLDYLNCFIENLDLPEASRASLRENCETLVTTPGAIDELVSAETLLFKDYGIDGAYGAEWKPIVPHMDALSERTGLHRHVVDFLFLALASERLRENYRAAGLTDELFWDTIADLKFKLIECHDVYGIWGTFVASWYPWFYTMHRFKLGRLQYEAVHFSGDAPVTVGGPAGRLRPGPSHGSLRPGEEQEPAGFRSGSFRPEERDLRILQKRSRWQADGIPLPLLAFVPEEPRNSARDAQYGRFHR